MHTIKTVYNSIQAHNHFSRKEKILGQFFTPHEVADFIVSFSSKYLTSGKIGCDPACGDGIFLSSLNKHGFKPIGFDVDESVIKLVSDDLKDMVIIRDSLSLSENKKFDLVVGNPPFSSKYGRVNGEIIKKFELGKNLPSQAIEILFLEQFIKLCKDDGIIGIILPEGIFSDLRLDYVRKYIRERLSIIAVISLPRNIFRSIGNKTSSKTCILIAKRTTQPLKGKVMFACVNSLDELSFKSIPRKIYTAPNDFLYPEFYIERNPKLEVLPKLKDFDIEIIQGSTKYGDEREFSSRGIPFISAKTISPIGIDFNRDERYVKPDSIMDNKRAHVKIGEIVFVRVGVGCIGRAAVITKEGETGIADDWVYIIRINDSRLTPFYLVFWVLTSAMQKEIKRLARGVGTATIPIALVKELPVPIPNENILRECENKYKKLVSLRENKFFEEAQYLKDEVCNKLEIVMLGVEFRGHIT